MTNIRTEASTAIANVNGEMRSLASNSVEYAKYKARDISTGKQYAEREGPRSFQSTELLAQMIGKSGGAIVKNQIVHDNKENKMYVHPTLHSKNSPALQNGGAAHIYPGGAPSLQKRSQKDLLMTSQLNAHRDSSGHNYAGQPQGGLKSGNSNPSQLRATGVNKRTFGDDLTNRINHSYAMNHAAAMGHHILEPIISGTSAPGAPSVSADNKQSKGQTSQPIVHSHSGMNKSFDFVNNTKQIATFKVKQQTHRNGSREPISHSQNNSFMMPKSSSAGTTGNTATTHAKYMINQHYLKVIGQGDQQRVDVPKIISNSNQIGVPGQATGSTNNQVARNAFDQLRPLLEGKQNTQPPSSQTSTGFNTAASTGTGAPTNYHSHIQNASTMNHSQRLAMQGSSGRVPSVGSVGQKMVQVHSQDSRVGHGHGHGLGPVLSAAQSLKIQKRKVPETKINSTIGGLSTNLNHSNIGPKITNRTFSQLEQPVRSKKVVTSQTTNLPSQRTMKQAAQRQVLQAKEQNTQNNSFVKQSEKRSSTTENTLRKSITNSANSTAERVKAGKYLDNSASQSKQSTSYIEALQTYNAHSVTPDRIKIKRFHDKMKKGGVFEARVDQVDRKKFFDPHYVSEHAAYIYEHCLDTEEEQQPSPGYMVNQTDINASMREILVDWLIEVHLKFKLLPETLYLTVNLIDRFLEKQIVLRNKLQLVGVTAMLIASKYEEIYPPIVTDFVYITDNAYSKTEILEMEEQILTKLSFGIHFTSQYRFLERFFYLKEATENERYFAQFLVEGCLINASMLKYNYSVIAASALYLASKLCYSKEPWSKQLAQVTQLQETTLRSCAKEIYQQVLLRNIDDNSKLKAVFNKFASSKYGAVSTKVQQQQTAQQRDQKSDFNSNSRQAIAKFSSGNTGETEESQTKLSTENTSVQKQKRNQSQGANPSSKFKSSTHSLLKSSAPEGPGVSSQGESIQRSFDRSRGSTGGAGQILSSRGSITQQAPTQSQQASMVTHLHQLQLQQIEQLQQMQSNNPPRPQLSVRNHSSSKHFHYQPPPNFQQQRNSQGNLPRYQ